MWMKFLCLTLLMIVGKTIGLCVRVYIIEYDALLGFPYYYS